MDETPRDIADPTELDTLPADSVVLVAKTIRGERIPVAWQHSETGDWYGTGMASLSSAELLGGQSALLIHIGARPTFPGMTEIAWAIAKGRHFGWGISESSRNRRTRLDKNGTVLELRHSATGRVTKGCNRRVSERELITDSVEQVLTWIALGG